jgi:hypothetical protein
MTPLHHRYTGIPRLRDVLVWITVVGFVWAIGWWMI